MTKDPMIMPVLISALAHDWVYKNHSWSEDDFKAALFTHKIYEDNIKRNPLMTSHDLLSFIDRKLSNPMNKGELFIDMSKGGSEFQDQVQANGNASPNDEQQNGANLSYEPFDLQEIQSLNLIDQANYMQDKLEAYIELNDFKDD